MTVSAARPFILLATDEPWDEALLERLQRAWGPPARTDGTPLGPEDLARERERALEGARPTLYVTAPPHAGRTPLLMVTRGGPMGRSVADAPEGGFAVAAAPLLAASPARLVVVSPSSRAPGGDATAYWEALARDLVRLLRASFACADDQERLYEPPGGDPRARAWGLAYYGPDAARRIGHERLRAAPAHVDATPEGGWWVRVGDAPLVPGAARGRALDALARHLALDAAFPPPD